MSDRRVFRWATTSARLLIGTIVSVAAVILVVTAISLPWPTLTREPVSVSAMPAPAASTVACDGALLSLGRDPRDAASLAAAAPQTVTSGVTGGAPEADEQRLDAAGVSGGLGPLAFTAQPLERERVDVAAAGASTVSADDLRGFAASACRPPLLESWLVGGSGTTGASDLVLLANPGTVAATVQLTLFGAAGEQSPPGGSDLIVPPGTQRVVPLAGIALDEASPVIRVTATGAPVHASLQTSITRTLTPGGVDQVGAVPQPEQTQTIAGINVTRSPGAEGASDAATVLRVLAPSGDTTVRVTVTAIGRAEPAADPQEVALTAGQPTEIALPGLAVGAYTVEVVSEVPVVSAVWQATGFEEGDDFAWYTPSPEVAVPSLFAAPSGPPPALTVVNPADEAATVTVTSEDGAYQLELTVPARGTMTARLSPRTVYLLEPDAPVRAALSLTGDGALAGIPLWPADAATPEIVVYP
ncbi:large extracellular alpha-helical protein [Microbacterium sp. CFH 90308]|uniref:Large extracellular alpha-helical protein n=1 Tax=Microbacterium salsuginis TaxID=2722803 RepID=A0ABX1KB94_9MICO|nr:DUF5719 family protein [Microbacterium sp. CFH 90308]NLP83900.1 large extracellular alpha-helical protein [Microbacterium sp. CFH 90308]